MRCPFNVRGSACYLIIWRRATEFPPGPTRLDSAIPSILLTSKQQHRGGTLGWGIHLGAAFRFWCISVCACVCVSAHPTGVPSRVDAVSLLQMILWETRWQPSSVQLHMPHHHTRTHTGTHTHASRCCSGPPVSEACWSQGKTPSAYPVSSEKVSISLSKSAKEMCLRWQNVLFTRRPCPSRLLTADNTALARTIPLF